MRSSVRERSSIRYQHSRILRYCGCHFSFDTSHRRREIRKIGLRIKYTLRDRALQPLPGLLRGRLPRCAACQVAPEHQLGVTVPALGGGAEPFLGGATIARQTMAIPVHRAECKHRAAVALRRRVLE